MTKKNANFLITTLIVISLGGYLLYQYLPFLLTFATSSVYSILFLVVLLVLIFAIYRLVRVLNK